MGLSSAGRRHQAATIGYRTWARASSPTRSAGRTRPTRRRCCSTTTTTSPARTAPTPRATPCTRGSSRCSPRAYRSTASATRATWTRSTASMAPRMQTDLARYAALGLKVAITRANVRTFVETTDNAQTPADNLPSSPSRSNSTRCSRPASTFRGFASRSPSGTPTTPIRGCPRPSPAKATRRSTTSTSTPSRRTPVCSRIWHLAASKAPRTGCRAAGEVTLPAIRHQARCNPDARAA